MDRWLFKCAGFFLFNKSKELERLSLDSCKINDLSFALQLINLRELRIPKHLSSNALKPLKFHPNLKTTVRGPKEIQIVYI